MRHSTTRDSAVQTPYIGATRTDAERVPASRPVGGYPGISRKSGYACRTDAERMGVPVQEPNGPGGAPQGARRPSAAQGVTMREGVWGGGTAGGSPHPWPGPYACMRARSSLCTRSRRRACMHAPPVEAHAARPDRTARIRACMVAPAARPGNRLALAPRRGGRVGEARACGRARRRPRRRARARRRTHARENQTAMPGTVIAPDISPPPTPHFNSW